MTLKQHYASFMLFIYNDHIKEDWDEWNAIGKVVIYPFWLIRAIVIWTVCPLYIPEYFLKRSVWYKNISASYTGFLNTSLEDMDKIVHNNKINTNTFLNRKYGSGHFKFRINRKNKKK